MIENDISTLQQNRQIIQCLTRNVNPADCRLSQLPTATPRLGVISMALRQLGDAAAYAEKMHQW